MNGYYGNQGFKLPCFKTFTFFFFTCCESCFEKIEDIISQHWKASHANRSGRLIKQKYWKNTIVHIFPLIKNGFAEISAFLSFIIQKQNLLVSKHTEKIQTVKIQIFVLQKPGNWSLKLFTKFTIRLLQVYFKNAICWKHIEYWVCLLLDFPWPHISASIFIIWVQFWPLIHFNSNSLIQLVGKHWNVCTSVE